ncbi:MAG: oxygen-independent coproporphyrinogen III oxidase [Halothece sp.]
MDCLQQTVQFDERLLKKYDQPLPRYTSYPPATELNSGLLETNFKTAIAASNESQSPLSLYCHIPFCQSACYFCGCNVVVTQRKEVVEPYLHYLYRNIEQTSELISRDRKVSQLHWGGGTPNYLQLDQVDALWNKLNQHFSFEDNAEISIEVNPRFIDRNYIFFLRSLGFNRISFGIQDFNPQVQQAVNRVQPEELLFNVMDWIQEAGFESVNVDLIYGLPYQTLETFKDTVNKVIKLNPDRIALFNFAYVPWMKPVQKNILPQTLPNAQEKLAIFQMSIDKLTESGYVFIGMDHFAKPNDELAIAQRERTLHRNFQGYTTTQPEADLIGFGLTSISMLHDFYGQNYKRLKDYYKAIDSGVLPLEKGISLSRDDILRREIIMKLMSHFQLRFAEIELKYCINFTQYFEQELKELEKLENDGLIERESDRILVTPIGRLLIRNIASVFDIYLRYQRQQRFSKAI